MKENEHFNMMIKQRLDEIEDVFEKKQKEYAISEPLHNFMKAKILSGKSMKNIWYGYFLKHYTSLTDFIDGYLEPKEELVKEKVTDMIVYLLLLEHILKEEKDENS